jgi:hypothetical protein
MKRCPQCGNTYTNDELVFCLEDGATLLVVRDSRQSFDPEATLRISPEENALAPTQVARPQAAQTIRQPTPQQTVPPRAGSHSTNDHTTQPAPAAPAQRSTSPIVIALISAIVVLLLVIAGIGIALLVRNSSSGNVAVNNDNKSGASDRETSRNSSNTVSQTSATSNSANKQGANSANRSGANAMGALERAEAKVVRGTPLEESDLSALSGDELRRLRNTVYARHGRTFDSADLQRYFDSRPWYKPRYDYNESELTATDLANVKLIQAAENSR